LAFTTGSVDNHRVLAAYGTLDHSTFDRMLNAVVRAAKGRHHALIIDVSELRVADSSVFSCLTVAQARIARRSNMSMVVVCETLTGHIALRTGGIDEAIPVFLRVNTALAALREVDNYGSARSQLPDALGAQRSLEQWATTPLATATGGVSTANPPVGS